MTTRTFLDPAQIALLLDLASIERSDASPLPPGEPCDLDSDAGRLLRRRGLVVEHDGEARTNLLFREVFAAAAQPDEVLRLQATGPGAPGFTLCRRANVWTECTSAADGTTKFEYPLSRSVVIAAAVTALSGGGDEVPPVRFRFRGRPADGLVLVALAAAGPRGVTTTDIDAHVRDYVTTHTGAGIAAALGDAAGTLALATSTRAAIERLLADGHLVEHGTALVASRRALAVLRTPAEAGFIASQTVVEDDVPRTKAIQVWHAGGRQLVTRPVTLAGGTLGVEWTDLQRAELRALVAAVYAAPGSLAALEA